MKWKNNFIWILWGIITLFLGWYVLFVAEIQQAGDIAEYYSVTESIINHQSVNLTDQDRANLEQVLHPAYFEMPGYYLEGLNANRYPVHFWFYPLLAVPFRVLLQFLNLNPIRSLFLVNLSSVVITVGFIIKRYLNKFLPKLALMVSVFTGALLSFLVWPGPDLWYLSLLLIVPFVFFKREYWLAGLLVALASWQSQPLIILAAGLTVYALFDSAKFNNSRLLASIKKLNFKSLAKATGIGILALIPYGYNLVVFGVLTPWTSLKDGWTVMRGFGLHNASLWKLYEQWFDLNIGLFWYASLVFALAVLAVVRLGTNDKTNRFRLLFFVGFSLVTAFFYQTNPAWHYGTVGFGPGRHGVYLLPILIYFAIKFIPAKVVGYLLIGIVGATQILSLSLNGYLEPDFTNSLRHSPYARFVLNRWPDLYQPTPEIFMDRTNHTDRDYPTSAVYQAEGQCLKVYVLKHDTSVLIERCGHIPSQKRAKLDNSLERLANYDREILTKEATFWPVPEACTQGFEETEQKPYRCLRSKQKFSQETGLKDLSRLKTLQEYPYPGVWKVDWGEPVKLTVPAGYKVNHYSLKGSYVTYSAQ
ncbi:MAG: hypothetical protein U9O78_05100 [Patescibacteria group bacterium]|nr:hypothetical protein [Patescibacteria group bacterium]